MFRFFDPDAETDVTRRDLPHWEQPDVCYFITFRTADSLPAAVLDDYTFIRDAWLRRHQINSENEEWHQQLGTLPEKDRAEFHREFSRRFHELLDTGHGECHLKQMAVRRIVEASLQFFAGERYELGDFVIMPNHVHVLVQFTGENRLKDQCYSWKKFTAREINRLLGRRGHFWQGESYDHIVRSAAEFEHYQKYIANNPVKARLHEGEYEHYRCSV